MRLEGEPPAFWAVLRFLTERENFLSVVLP